MRVVVVAIVAFLGGAVAGILSGVGGRQPVVHVHITNASTKDIEVVTVRGSHGAALVEGMPAQGVGDTVVYCPSESSMTLEVRFRDGEVLKGMAGYVEGGYSVTATVEKEKIVVATKLRSL